MVQRNVIVIGGSAGAVGIVTNILRELPGDLRASVFVALHVATTCGDWLPSLFARTSKLPVESPTQERPIEAGRVYVARPDHHLIVKEGRVLANRGPRENLWRPAIDVLFRSAAVAYGNRVIGVLTSGELDDGTAGLQAIKCCGGATVVQSPEDAMHPAMLLTALANAEIDHCAPLQEIPALLVRLAREPADPPAAIPDQLRKEARMVEAPDEAASLMMERGEPDALSCPECSGPLWRTGVDRIQFRCVVGHAFHLDTLADGDDDELDRTLWAAIRMFEQRVNISRMLAEQERTRGREKRVQLYDVRAAESRRYARILRELHQERHLVLDEEPPAGQPRPQAGLRRDRQESG